MYGYQGMKGGFRQILLVFFDLHCKNTTLHVGIYLFTKIPTYIYIIKYNILKYNSYVRDKYKYIYIYNDMI